MKLKKIVIVAFLILPCLDIATCAANTTTTTAANSSTTTLVPSTSNPTLSPECFNYKFLNESDRAQTYNKSSPVLCDSTLQLGWYRFGGEAGNQMSESCVSTGHCGTRAPGWLNGNHPSFADGAVKRKVCFHEPSMCCLFEIDITVRNCGGFYVYKLTPPRICDSRYCGNGVTPTPETTATPARATTTTFSRPPTKLPTTKEVLSTPLLVTPTQRS